MELHAPPSKLPWVALGVANLARIDVQLNTVSLSLLLQPMKLEADDVLKPKMYVEDIRHREGSLELHVCCTDRLDLHLCLV